MSVAPDMAGEKASYDRVYYAVYLALRLEQNMKNISEESKSYWRMLNVLPPFLFDGTDDARE